MATPVVTPYVLMKALQDARIKGAPNDPYGLAAAFRSMGGDYDAMNKSIIGSNLASRDSAETSARLDSGYYPAQVAQQMAGFGRKTYDDTHHVTMAQAVEEAHKYASQRGPAGSPEYEKAMNVYLSEHGPYQAAADTIKGAREASKTLQERGAAQSFVKDAVLKKLKFDIAQDWYNRNSKDQSMTPEQKLALAKQAREHAETQISENDVQVKMGPDGEISVTDASGVERLIPPRVTATALAIMGDNVPLKALDVLSADARKELDQIRAAALAQRKIDTPDKAVKPTEDPMHKLLLKEYEDLRKARHALAGKNQEGIEVGYAAKLDKEIEDVRQKLYGTVTPAPAVAPGKAFDPNTLVTQVGGPAGPTPYSGPASDFVAPPNMMYGMEPDNAPGSGFPDEYFPADAGQGMIRYGA